MQAKAIEMPGIGFTGTLPASWSNLTEVKHDLESILWHVEHHLSPHGSNTDALVEH